MSTSIERSIKELGITGAEEAFFRYFSENADKENYDKNLQIKVRTLIDGYWLAETLGPPVLKWVAEKYFNDVFGSQENTINIAEIIENAIRRIAGIVKSAINEEALRATLANLNSTQRIFSEYLSAPTDDRLNQVTNDSSLVISNLSSLNINGHDSYIGAVTLRISILQARFKKLPSIELKKGELHNIIRLIDEGIEHHNNMKNSWADWNRSRHRIETVCRGSFCGFWVYRDNELLKKFGNRDQRLRPYMEEQIISIFNEDIYPNHIQPGDEAIKKWDINKKAIRQAIQENNINENYIIELINRQTF